MKRPFINVWLDTLFSRKSTEMYSDQSLAGKTIIFTGGTDGMGRVAIERFAQMEADVCLLGRNLDKTQQLAEELTSKGYKGEFTAIQCDLSSLTQVRDAAHQILSKFEQVHYLVNCAGINMPERTLNSLGHEINFTVNYLAPFLLTEMLLDRIKSTDSSRIIQLASATQSVAKLNFNDLHLEKNWSLLASYAQAKLCLIMHSRDLAKRLKGSGVTINSLNPGYISTNLTRNIKGFERVINKLITNLAAPTWVGGERIVAATLDEKYKDHSGAFIYEDVITDPNPLALDDENIIKLMAKTRELTGLM